MKEDAENGEVKRRGWEELQQDEEKLEEESDMEGEKEEAGVGEFTRDWFRAFSQSITAEVRMNKKKYLWDHST